MPTIMYRITDPAFCEFVFHCMQNVSKDVLLELSPAELRWFDSKIKMRRFADKETLEKRLLLLARMGVSYTVVLAADKSKASTILEKTIPDTFRIVKDRAALIKQMHKDDVFVFGSREVSMITHMAAQNSHAEVYILDPVYAEMSRKVNDAIVRSEYINKDIKEAIKGFDEIARIAVASILTVETVPGILGINQEQLNMLLVMLPLRGNYVTIDTLCTLLHQTRRTRNGVAKSATNLTKLGYIAAIHDGQTGRKRTTEYTIMEPGINAAVKWLKYMLKQKED